MEITCNGFEGRLDYASTAARMRGRRDAMLAGRAGPELILCEHPPTITLGRRTRPEHVLVSPLELARRGISLFEIERGGDVTYHGPGQLMIYPVVHVGVRVRAFIEGVFAVLERELCADGVAAAYRGREPGLWVGDRKIAACGLHLHRGISIHGFALNVCTTVGDWSPIVPCGLAGLPPTSMAEEGAQESEVGVLAGRLQSSLLAFLDGGLSDS